MAHLVLRTKSAGRIAEGFGKPERRAYDAAVAALRGEGCRAGGKRLLALDGTDFPLCQRSLYGAWRMTTAFPDEGSIVIVSLAKHTPQDNPNRVLAEVFPELSSAGRRRSEQPPCCEDAADPPVLGADLVEMILDLFGV